MDAAEIHAHPPYEIHGLDLVLRCWQPADAPLLKEAVDSSLDHLRPWMPWTAHEPQTIDEKVDLLRGFRGKYDLGIDFVLGIFDADQSRVLGGTGLHPRGGPNSLEIGYWVRADSLRQGVATRVVTLLARTAFHRCRVDRLDITVAPDNDASLAIPRRLGFTEHEELGTCAVADVDGSPRPAVVFTMEPDAFDRSTMARCDVRWLDAAARELASPSV